MNRKTALRVVSLLMLLVAVVFVICALSNPALGTAVSIGGFSFGAEQWRVCYLLYAAIMVFLFTASFFAKKK